MTNVDERLGTLEANDKALFHQVDELKEEVRDIRRLTVAIEKIAGKVDSIDLKVDNVDSKVNGIDERLQTVEHVPATNWNYEMLKNTGGTFTSNPSINTTYYVENAPV